MQRNTRILNLGCPVNLASPFARNLVAFWSVGRCGIYRGGPKLVDLVGVTKKQRVNDGTLTNGPTWSGFAPPGGSGSLNFTSTNKVTLADSVLPYSTVTVLMSVNIAGNTGLMSIGSDDVTGASHGLDVSAGKLRVYQRDVYNSGSTTLPTNAWLRVGFSTAPATSTSNFWLNGASDGTFNGAGSVYSTKNYIGYWPFGSNSNKYIADILIYNRKLSAAEVAADYLEFLLNYPTLLNYVSRPVAVAAAATATTLRRTLFGRAGARSAA